MATREAASDTDLTEDSWTTGAAILKASSNYDTVTGVKYWHTVCGVGQNDGSLSVDPYLAIADPTPTKYQDALVGYNVSDYGLALSMEQETAAGTSTQGLRFYLEGSTAGTCRAKYSHAVTLELRGSDGDQQAASVGTSTTTSTSMQDKLTKTWTPASDGDYLIIAMAQIKSGSVTKKVECQLDVDSAAYHLMKHTPRNTAEWYPWCCVFGAISGETLGQFDASEHVVKIQYRSVDAAVTVEIKEAHIIILRLDTFANFSYSEALGRATDTTGAYVTKLAHAPTITNSGDHLIVAACHLDGTSGSGRFTGGQVTSGGTTMVESIVYPTANVGADDYGLYFSRVENLTSGASATNTWDIDVKKGGSGVGGGGVEHMAICVIELAEAATTKTAFLGRLAGMSSTVLAHTSQ